MSRYEDAGVADGMLTLEQYRRQQERERMERRARQVMRDMAYKQALGLPLGEPLPKQLGAIGAHSPRTGLRGSKRLAS